MNILPLLLIALLLGGNRISSAKNFLSKIDFKSFAPLLKLLGINEKTIEFLCSDEFTNAIEGDLDAKNLMSIATAAANAFSKTGGDKEKDAPEDKTDANSEVFGEKLNPIKDVASTDIEENLGSFFS